MENNYIPRKVVNQQDEIYIVTDIVLSGGGKEFNVTVDNFESTFNEYIDPLQVEINRLIAENKKLKSQLKPLRKRRRKLTNGEITDVRADIEAGSNNSEIAKEYDVSSSVISRIRVRMRKEGKDV